MVWKMGIMVVLQGVKPRASEVKAGGRKAEASVGGRDSSRSPIKCGQPPSPQGLWGVRRCGSRGGWETLASSLHERPESYKKQTRRDGGKGLRK